MVVVNIDDYHSIIHEHMELMTTILHMPLIDMSIELEVEDCAAARPTMVRRLRSIMIAVVLIPG
jgi:hypothetical protein